MNSDENGKHLDSWFNPTPQELQCSFSEISAEEPQAVLCKVLLSQQPERYKKAQAFISIQGLQPDTVAQLVSTAVVQGLLAATQEPEPGGETVLLMHF